MESKKKSAMGRYGFTRNVERHAEVASRKVARHAIKIAKRIFAKDEDVVPFLTTHAKRERSKSAAVLLSAMREIGPRLASKTAASKSGLGLYGFKERTASLGIEACSEIRIAAGRIAADLHARKADLHDPLVGFFKAHYKEAKCPYSSILSSCYPDSGAKLASAAPVKVAAFAGTTLVVDVKTGRSGSIKDVELVPTFERTFKQKKAQFFGDSDVDVHVTDMRDVHVSHGGDADGVFDVKVARADGRFFLYEIPFTGTFEPGPRMFEASGGWIEWED